MGACVKWSDQQRQRMERECEGGWRRVVGMDGKYNVQFSLWLLCLFRCNEKMPRSPGAFTRGPVWLQKYTRVTNTHKKSVIHRSEEGKEKQTPCTNVFLAPRLHCPMIAAEPAGLCVLYCSCRCFMCVNFVCVCVRDRDRLFVCVL